MLKIKQIKDMNLKIILLSLLAFVGVFGLSQMALAENPILSVSPATLNIAVNAPFNVSVQLNPLSNNVCVVTGSINFDGLNCQSIAVTNGLIAQTAPTCTSPNFIIGIPKCTTVPQDIFSLSVKGNRVGRSELSFTELKIIGAGSNVSSVWYGGAYNIITATQPAPIATQQPRTQIVQPAEQATPEATILEITGQETPSVNDIPTGIGAEGQQASLATTSSPRTITIIIIVLLAIAVIGGGWYILSKKNKKEV